MMTVESLDAFFRDGWNRHDLNVPMTFMTDDCVFEGATGTAVCGTRYAGRERVREAFAGVFAAVPDATFREVRHVVAGDRGVSEWALTGTTTEGRALEVNGCDLFELRGGKIAVKSSFLKQRTA